MISRAAEQLGYDEHTLVEKEPYQRSVLAKRFIGSDIYNNVVGLDFTDMRGYVDILHGGSPCQGFSAAGLGQALQDPRSKLIMELVRVVGECQPRIVLIENVAVLRSRGLIMVIDALVRYDYFCWWDCVPALAVGAPHLRDRVWITAVHADEMPDLDGRPLKLGTADKLPRAGALTSRGLIEMEPSATIKAAKEAMGAVKQADGTTWLTKLDSPLFPTPSAVSYGSNQGGAAGRVGRQRHSLESMARLGLFPTPTVNHPRSAANKTACRSDPNGSHHSGVTLTDYVRLWPTPVQGDAMGSRQPIDGTSPTGKRPDGSKAPVSLAHAVRHDQKLWPTAGARDYKDMALGNGAIGRGQLPEAIRNSLRDQNGVGRMWPSPAAAADGSRGPGRSEHRSGGPNLRTAVDENHGPGPLNPGWVEWLMGMPVGWTDIEADNDDLISLDWLSEYGIPRVAKGVPNRKDRLICCGNACLAQIAYLRIQQAHELLEIET